MSVVDSFKKWFNLGGISMIVKIDRNFKKQDGEIQGKVVISSEGVRTVKKLEIYLEQHCKKSDNSIDIIKIGSTTCELNEVMNPGDAKTVDFTLAHSTKDSLGNKVTDAMMNQGGLLSMVGAVGSMVQNAQLNYYLTVKADIEGALFKPSEGAVVKLI